MTKRQQALLKELLEKYIGQAEPVSSALLAKRLKVSSATVRNELAELEEQGYVQQPHTSAGRIPTLKGYQLYVDHHLDPKPPADGLAKRLKACSGAQHQAKAMAKELAELTHAAVMLALQKDSYYYTGLSELFSQPEFNNQQTVVSISRVLDVLGEALDALYKNAADETSVLIGDANPVSPACAIFVNRCQVEKGKEGVLAMVAPLRTDYNRNISLLSLAKKLLDQHNA